MNDAWKPWPVCPAEECGQTEGITIMECAPGHTYITVGDVCHHSVFLYRNTVPVPDGESDLLAELFSPVDVPRETSPGQVEIPSEGELMRQIFPEHFKED